MTMAKRAEKGSPVAVISPRSSYSVMMTADPEVIITEYQLHGEMTATGEPFSVRFAMVITVRDGHIVHSRDYSDPIAGARLLGRLPELVSALS